jgi:hypothetical protein
MEWLPFSGDRTVAAGLGSASTGDSQEQDAHQDAARDKIAENACHISIHNLKLTDSRRLADPLPMPIDAMIG